MFRDDGGPDLTGEGEREFARETNELADSMLGSCDCNTLALMFHEPSGHANYYSDSWWWSEYRSSVHHEAASVCHSSENVIIHFIIVLPIGDIMRWPGWLWSRYMYFILLLPSRY